MTSAAAPMSFVYVESDVPDGQTLSEWRSARERQRAAARSARRRRLAFGRRSRR
jgi:hypothetical protein